MAIDRDADRGFESVAKALGELPRPKRTKIADSIDEGFDSLDMDPYLLRSDDDDEYVDNRGYVMDYARPSAGLADTRGAETFILPLEDAGDGAVNLVLARGQGSATFTRATVASCREKLTAPYLLLPGVALNYASTPDNARVSVTGDIDIRVKARMNDWTNALSAFVAKDSGGAGNRSFAFRITAVGHLDFYFSASGTAVTSNVTSGAAVPFGNDEDGFVRVTRVASSGETRFWTSTDGLVWTQLGATQSTTAGSMFDSPYQVEIGTRLGGANDAFLGRIYLAEIRDRIDGTIVAKFDPSEATGVEPTSFVSSSGETWTINQSGAIKANLIRYGLKKVASGVARSHYLADGTYGGYLAEGARTNLCLQSEDLSTTWTNNRSSETVNAIVAPDGTLTADKLVEDGTAGNSHFISQAFTFTNAVHTVSVFAKAGERTWVSVIIFDGTTSFIGNFNLTTGEVGTAGNTTQSIESWGNGWYRCSITTNAAVAAAAGTVDLYLNEADNDRTYDGNGTSGAYFWGAQLEAAAFASSYIPTTTAAVTRNLDALTYPGGAGNIADAGTIFAEATAPNDPATGLFSRILELSDGTTNERVGIARNTGVGRVFIFDGGANQFPATQVGDAWADGATKKFALRYAVNDCAASLAGSAILADTSITVPSGLNLINVGMQQSSSAHWWGTVKNVHLWQTKLSNARLQELTT